MFNLELRRKIKPNPNLKSFIKQYSLILLDLYLLLLFPSQCLVRMISCWAAAEPAAYGPTVSSYRMRTHQAWTTCWLWVCRVMESCFLEVEATASGVGSGTTTSGRHQAPLEMLHFSHPITTTQTLLQAQTLQSRIPIKQVNVVIGWFEKYYKLACRIKIKNMIFTEAMLPCEFCEELFPEEDLILHQVRKKIDHSLWTLSLIMFTNSARGMLVSKQISNTPTCQSELWGQQNLVF